MRRCSLRSGAGEKDCSEKLGEEDWRGGGEEGGGVQREGVLIKSSNPHLAAGEKRSLKASQPLKRDDNM